MLNNEVVFIWKLDILFNLLLNLDIEWFMKVKLDNNSLLKLKLIDFFLL